jgi:hypothetical protein
MTTNLLTAEQISKLVATIAKSGAKLDKDIQKVAVSAIGHAVLHKNIVPANQLFKAMPNGSRKQSLIAYFEENAPLVFVTADKEFGYYDNPKVTGFDQEALMGLAWHDAKREVLKSSYDVDQAFARFMKAVEKAVADGLEVKGIEKFKAIKEFNAKYESSLIDATLGV